VAEKKLVFVHPLAQLLNRQPDYKPLNLKEMTVSFALPSNEREVWYRVIETLERVHGEFVNFPTNAPERAVL
jgi:hypothetical protein